MAKQIYRGPYVVRPVTDKGWEPEAWEVVFRSQGLDGETWHTSLNPERVYKQRQGAYRFAAKLNRRYATKRPERVLTVEIE